jgi:kynurenine formamidase
MTDIATEPATRRWGADDERGALNLLDPATVLAATRVCRTGKVYNLGLPVQHEGVPIKPTVGAPHRLTVKGDGEPGIFSDRGAPPDLGANEDMLVLPTHNGTHIDALAHVYCGYKVYNGFDARDFTPSTGANRCGIEKMGGFAARAVLLDVAGHHGVPWLEPGTLITGDDLEACRAAEGVEIGRGDVVLIRTGELERFAAEGSSQPSRGQAGVGRSTVPFFADHDVCAVGADNIAVERVPFEEGMLAVHVALLVERGIALLEHVVLAELAADRCHESLLVAAPLLITGASGSPLNPIAIG